MQAALLAALGLVSGSQTQDAVTVARAHREAQGAAILAEFRELLTLPCVASDLAGIDRNAEFIERAFARRGVRLERLRIDGAPPALYGRIEVEGASRTLGVYVHYDGQPVDPTRWTFGPWEPTLTTRALEAGGEPRAFPRAGESIDPEWRIYARAAGDDKAPIVAWLAALDALAEAKIEPTANIVFWFDGEEEAGSPHLARYVEAHREKLDVDVWCFWDGPVHQSRRPQLAFGVRGIVGLDVTVYGAVRPLHSGHYGNFAPNAGERLARLLASLEDDEGRCLVDGFYDSARPLSESEREVLAGLPDFDAELRAELGLARSEGAASYFDSLLRPSLNVRGLASGNVGAAARNVIPSVANASLDIRLVSGNDPESMLDLVERHIAKQGYEIVREEPDMETRLEHPRIAKVVRGGGYAAARTPMDLEISREVIANVRRVAGDELILIPTLGGSLPLYLFSEGLATPIVIVPIANHDDNQHAPDENIRIANLWYGIELAAALLTSK